MRGRDSPHSRYDPQDDRLVCCKHKQPCGFVEVPSWPTVAVATSLAAMDDTVLLQFSAIHAATPLSRETFQAGPPAR